jgi:hypothetical protein
MGPLRDGSLQKLLHVRWLASRFPTIPRTKVLSPESSILSKSTSHRGVVTSLRYDAKQLVYMNSVSIHNRNGLSDLSFALHILVHSTRQPYSVPPNQAYTPTPAESITEQWG